MKECVIIRIINETVTKKKCIISIYDDMNMSSIIWSSEQLSHGHDVMLSMMT